MLSEDYSHAQSFDREAVVPDVTFKAPPRKWYPERVKLLFVFYVVAFFGQLGYFAVYTVLQHPKGPVLYHRTEHVKFGWHFVFFSYWIGVLLIIFFAMSIVDLCLRHSQVSERFHAVKDWMYRLLFPQTMLIVATYWFTVLPNRFEKGEAKTARFLEDLCQYGLSGTFVLIETLAIPHRQSARAVKDILPPALLYAVFVGWSYICRVRNGEWAYRFQASIDPWLVAFAYAAGVVAVGLFAVVGKMIARCRWPAEVDLDGEGAQGNPEAPARPTDEFPGVVDDDDDRVPYAFLSQAAVIASRAGNGGGNGGGNAVAVEGGGAGGGGGGGGGGSAGGAVGDTGGGSRNGKPSGRAGGSGKAGRASRAESVSVARVNGPS